MSFTGASLVRIRLDDSAVPGAVVRPKYVNYRHAPEDVHDEPIDDRGPIVDVNIEVVAAVWVGVQVNHLREEVAVQIDEGFAPYDDPHLPHGSEQHLLYRLRVGLEGAGHASVLDWVSGVFEEFLAVVRFACVLDFEPDHDEEARLDTVEQGWKHVGPRLALHKVGIVRVSNRLVNSQAEKPDNEHNENCCQQFFDHRVSCLLLLDSLSKEVGNQVDNS